jgi:AraC family transcriptional activator of pobA
MKQKVPDFNRYYPIDSLGNLKVSLSEIRIEKIKDRHIPKVPFPHKYDFFHIMFVKEGSGWHEIDFNKFNVNPPQAFVVKPGQVHAWKLNEDAIGYIVEFKRESLDANVPISSDLINQILVSRDCFKLKDKECTKILNTSREMYSEMIEGKALSDISLQGFITSLLVFIVRIIGEGDPNKLLKQNLTDNFIEIVNLNYKKEHRVEYYAKRLGVSVKTLNTTIKRTFHKTPRTIIQDRFILEAKRLLSYSHLSVAEIGYEIGFEDPNYFSRFFRKHMKISPAEFQKKHRQKKATHNEHDNNNN